MKNKQLLGSLMLLVAALAWGLSYSVQSLANNLGTFTIAFFKCFGGVFLLLAAIIKKAKFDKKTIIDGILIGAVACTGLILQQKGLELSSAANASFITALYIVFTPLLSLLLGKKISKKIYLSIIIAMVGMYLLCINGEFVIRIGDVILTIGAVMFALQIILIDKFIDGVDAVAFTAVQQITGAIITGILMFITEKPNITNVVSCLPHILYMVFFSGVGAQYLQNRFQRDVNPTLASLLMSFESVFGALFGWIILNQVLGIKEIIGCVFIFIAILIAE